MKCILLVMARLEAGAPQDTKLTDCLKEECAWWHTYEDAHGTTHAACVLIHIADKKEVES